MNWIYYYVVQSLIPICSTAIWNATYTILAGSTSNAGSTSTLLYSPYNTFIDIYQYLYVADSTNHRIQRFPRGIILSLTRNEDFQNLFSSS